MRREYKALETTFVDGKRYKPGERFKTSHPQSKAWEAVGEKPAAAPEKDDERDEVAAEYEVVFGKKPHHKAKAETLRQEIDEHKAKMAD